MKEAKSPKSSVASNQPASKTEPFFSKNSANPFFKAQSAPIQKQDQPKRSAGPQTTDKPANTNNLPEGLKNGVEQLSGYAMDDVKVHRNSSKPKEVGALAYAQGTDIHLGSGQEKHLPHEAWHVVQQKQGRVKPTLQMKGGVNVNDDAGLEAEADVMGEKAMQLRQSKTPIPKPKPLSLNHFPIQRRILDAHGAPINIDAAVLELETAIPAAKRSRLRPNLFRRLVEGLVDSSVKDFSLQEAKEMLISRNTQLATGNDNSALSTSHPDSISAPGLKLTSSLLGPSKSKQLGRMISADEGTHFAESVEPNMDANAASMTSSGPQALVAAADPEDIARRARNLANLMRDLPKVKIKKGTRLLHVTSDRGDWLKKGFVGGNQPEGYSFFTLLSRGPGDAHTSDVSAALVYVLDRDIDAFFVQQYQSIVLNKQKTTHATGDHHTISSESGGLNLGGDFAISLLENLPMDQRIKAFISPSEAELAFYNHAIPQFLTRSTLITNKAGGTIHPSKILSTDSRKVEQLQ
ncbi:MAG: DUF4157 domain-containing protein [Bacteroidia bacterium]